MTYDLIIIGGGPAGYHAALLAGRAGRAVLLIEKRAIGGVCLNEGCIPTKTLLHSARLLDHARRGERYGLAVSDAAVDHRKVLDRKNKVVKILVTGITADLKKTGVTVISASGRIMGRNKDLFQVSAGTEVYDGRRVLIAAGSTPVLPPLPGLPEGLADGRIATSREILEWEMIPASLAVIGAGAVGLEFASYFNTMGSRVTVIEMLPAIGGTLDREMAGLLQKNLSRQGIAFLLETAVAGFEAGSVLFRAKDGAEGKIGADKALLAVGRRPAISDLGLETIGVAVDGGRIVTDDRCRTNIEGVSAAGDVNGLSPLAHTAYREAEVAVDAMRGGSDRIRYRSIPAVIYTDPEAAWAGDNAETARAKGIEAEAATISLRYSGRYLIENEGGDGACRVVFEKKTGRLLGFQMVGTPASEIIFGISAMLERGMVLSEIGRMVFPHPTVSEIMHEAALRLG